MHSSVPSGGASGGTGRKDVTSGEELGPEDGSDLGDLPGSWAWPDPLRNLMLSASSQDCGLPPTSKTLKHKSSY